MQPSLRRRLDRLEVQRCAVLAELTPWPEARLRFRMAPGTWSALEVLDHLVKTDTGIGEALARGLAEPSSIRWRDRGGRLLVHVAMLAPTRIKVPAKAAMVLPEPTADMATILAEWNASRERLRACLASVQQEQLGVGVFRHPVAGWTTAAGTLGFLGVHLHHHRYQLRRLARASRQAGLAG